MSTGGQARRPAPTRGFHFRSSSAGGTAAHAVASFGRRAGYAGLSDESCH
ncbi:hypothetical protein [Gimesia panareensis]|nr:hypothetical protein [Gimesia panareensis]